jgi:uncharacterized protein (DUF362 family)
VAVNRRTFLHAGAAGAVGLVVAPRLASAQGHRVGVGVDLSGYAAARRAIASAGTWPAAQIAGRRVILKPNLLAPVPSSTGVTTDPEVTRAVVDLALESGASEVLIVESCSIGANFTACGYGFFSSYDPAGRVRLVDLSLETNVLAPVPSGLAYFGIVMPQIVLDPQAFYVSIGKMKTHAETLATLATKNQFGLPAVNQYISASGPAAGRFAMHDRGLSQAVVDINRTRPIHYAVIDGIVGMEGMGPRFGNPVSMNVVLAGANSVAVDRVALQAMQLNPVAVRYLQLASRLGLGPRDLDSVVVAGDPLPQKKFALPPFLAPLIEYPHVYAFRFAPRLGQSIKALVWYLEPVVRELNVLELFEDSPTVRVVRTLSAFENRTEGPEEMVWDGRDDTGTVVPPGRYALHMRARSVSSSIARAADGIGWVVAL